MYIDSHQHFWNFDKMTYTWPTENEKPIYRNIEPDELENILKENEVDKTVVVQAKDSCDETDYLLDLAERYEWIAGVVGWVPLENPSETEKKIKHYIKNKYFKGVRHLMHEEPDPDWVVKENVIESLKVLAKYEIPFDVVAIFPNHLEHIPTIVEQVPNLKLVLDHLGKPPITEKQFNEWSTEIKEVANHPQVYAKISGLNTAASQNWDHQELKLYIDFALKVFGADRLMFGSDWPVANLNGDYSTVWKETKKALSDLTEEDWNAVLGKTANEFYDLKIGGVNS